MKECPYCAEEIQDKAIKCKHCGEMLDGNSRNKEEINSVEMIEENGGCGLAFISLLIPGLGQMAKGQVAKGLVFLGLAIGIGVITFGVGAIIIALISAADASSPMFRCSSCRGIVDGDATICQHCQSRFEEEEESEVTVPQKDIDPAKKTRFIVMCFLTLLLILFLILWAESKRGDRRVSLSDKQFRISLHTGGS